MKQRVANRNVVREAQEAAEAAAAAAANMPDPPTVVDFDREDKIDGDKAVDKASKIMVPFRIDNVACGSLYSKVR